MDKWQQREAEQLARDEGVAVEQAAARLFPEQVPAAPEGEQVPAAPEGEQVPAAKAPDPKAKASAK